MKRKIRYGITVFVVCLLFCCLNVKTNAAEFVYNPDAAVEYAEKHWDTNDGTVCDQFVKNCLHAGGVTLRSGDVDPLKDALIDAGYGTLCEIKLVEDDLGGRVKKSDNPGVEAGDVFFFYCEDCKKSVHTVLISGFDSEGYMQCYGHNPAWELVDWFGNYKHETEDGKKHTNYKFYAVKMDTSVKDHKHDFGISSPNDLDATQKYENAHPHKMYDKCKECNVKYYLGWNATLSSCHICNPSPNGKPVLTVEPAEESGNIVMKLSWTAIADVDAYEVWRSKSVNGTYYKLGEVPSASFTNKSGEVGVTYYYKVKAVRSTGDNVWSDVVSVKWPGELISAPVLKNIRATDKDYPRISWNQVADEEKYEIYRKESDSTTFTRIYTTKYRSYTNSSVEPGKTYDYKVRAVFTDGTYGEFSNVVSIKVAELETTAPVLKNIRKTDADAPRVGWNKIDGAVKYEVYRKESDSSTYKRIFVTQYTTCTNSSVQAGVTYNYKVRAVFSDGSYGDYSNVVTIKCAGEKVTVPTLKNIRKTALDKPRIGWDKVDGAVKYEVYRKEAGSSSYKRISTTKYITLTNTSAKAGKTYSYKVRAVFADGTKGDFSNVVTIKNSSAPTLKNIRKTSTDKPRIGWDKVDGAVKYEVYRKESGSSSYKRISTTKYMTLTNTSAKAGKTYSYKVRAVFADGTKGSFSNVVSMKCTK